MLVNLLLSIIMLLTVPLVVGGIFLCLHVIKNYKYWENRNVPIIENFFMVNNIWKVFTGRFNFGQFLLEMYKEHPGKPYIGIYVLSKPHLFIRSPEIIKNITGKDFTHFENRSFVCNEEVDALVAKSVFFAKIAQWKETRTKLNVLFSPAKIRSMMSAILDTSKKMQTYLEQRDNQIVDFKIVSEDLATKILPWVLLGIDTHCDFGKSNNAIKHSIKTMFRGNWYQGFAFFSYCFIPKFVSWFNVSLADVDMLKDVTLGTKTYREDNKIKGKGIYDLLINTTTESNAETNSHFDENWLVSQALTLIVAGFTPIVSLFALTLYELSFNMDCQDQLRKEIFENFPDESEEVTYEKVMNMKYLNMVTNESIRKNSLGGFMNRTCTRDYVIKETGLKITKGTPIFISIDAIHTDPKYHPDPEKFDPERFRDGSKVLETAGSYMPFGNGPKRCIGERFGQVVAKVALVHVIKKFRVESCHQTEETVIVDPKALRMSPLNGIKLRVHKLQ